MIDVHSRLDNRAESRISAGTRETRAMGDLRSADVNDDAIAQSEFPVDSLHPVDSYRTTDNGSVRMDTK